MEGRMRLRECLRADVARLREEDPSLRALVRGLCSQGFLAILVYRAFRWCYERGIPTQPLRFLAERAVEVLTGISLPVGARIGKGLRIHHFGGVILHPEAELGDGCTLYQGVTLGDLGGRGGAPRVGSRVLLGAGAKVLGSVRLGDGCRVGANAVVLTSVPAGYVAVGVPAGLRPPRRAESPPAAEPAGEPVGVGGTR